MNEIEWRAVDRWNHPTDDQGLEPMQGEAFLGLDAGCSFSGFRMRLRVGAGGYRLGSDRPFAFLFSIPLVLLLGDRFIERQATFSTQP